jgi:hypothetical protein
MLLSDTLSVTTGIWLTTQISEHWPRVYQGDLSRIYSNESVSFFDGVTVEPTA